LDLIDPLVSAIALAFWGLVFGIVLGAIVGLISHGFSEGERDFSSVSGMEADRYAVMADDEEVAEEASRMLAEWRRA
jgi:Na+/glutamate symporter